MNFTKLTPNDIEELNNEFSLFELQMRVLFNPENMLYDSGDFYKFVEASNNSNEFLKEYLERNTFYSNRQKFEEYARPFSSPISTSKMSKTSEIYYLRLNHYLFSVSKFSSDKDIPFLRNLKVTINFFPLYIALIYSNSKISNWKSVVENVPKIYFCFFNSSNKDFRSLPYDTLNKLYLSWLNLLLPSKLEELISKINDTIRKEADYPTYSALRINVNAFLNTIANTSFKTQFLQNRFLSYANNLFDIYSQSRKKGITYKKNPDRNKNAIPQIYIADNLASDWIASLSSQYMEFEERLYSKYLQSQGNGMPLL